MEAQWEKDFVFKLDELSLKADTHKVEENCLLQAVFCSLSIHKDQNLQKAKMASALIWKKTMSFVTSSRIVFVPICSSLAELQGSYNLPPAQYCTIPQTPNLLAQHQSLT